MSEIKVGLVKGRHELPVDEYIFEEIKDPSDIEGIEKQAEDWVLSKLEPFLFYEETLVIYVTGLTVALTSVIKAAANSFCRHLVLMHYDKATNDYLRQIIF